MKIDRTCLNCRRREIGCHSRCPDYLAARKKLDEIRKRKEREQAAVYDADNLLVAGALKTTCRKCLDKTHKIYT